MALTLSSVGGHARAKSLSGKQRSAIASHAASIRHSSKPMRQAAITPEMTKRQRSSLQNQITKVRYNKKVPP